MDKRMMYIVVAVVAVIAIAAAAFVMTQGGNDGLAKKNIADLNKHLKDMYNTSDAEYPARLLILGNADLDDDLDADDLAIVKKVASTTDYDYVKNYFCDANFDGLINEDDVKLVEKMIAKDSKGQYTYNDVAYYVDCDFVVSKYHMDWPLHTSNILTQTLEMLCILQVDVVAVDDRVANSYISPSADNGTYWKEFAGVLNYPIKPEDLGPDGKANIGATGSYRQISSEQYLQVAREYGDGYLTAVMNSRYARGTEYLEEQLAGTNVQLIRIQSWERGGVCNGMLTLGYLFHKYDRAAAWVEWHDGYYNAIMKKVASIPDNERVGAIIAVLSDTDNASKDTFDMMGATSGEYQNLKKMGIIDVTGEYLKSIGASPQWSVTVNKEVLAQIYKDYKFKYFIGTFTGPYNISPFNPDRAVADVIYQQTKNYINEYCNGDVTLQLFGWIYSTGPHEMTYIAGLANTLYGWDEFDVKKITEESLEWMGILDKDGTKGEYYYTFEDIIDSMMWPNAY